MLVIAADARVAGNVASVQAFWSVPEMIAGLLFHPSARSPTRIAMVMRCFAVLGIAAAIAGCSGMPVSTAVPAVTNAVSPTPGLVAGGRLAATDMDALRRAGIAEVIDLSVDSETPDFDEGDAVRAAGMRYVNLPLRGGKDLTRENVEAFDAVLRASPRPVLVHCASGNRVGAMAALRAAWIERRGVDDAIAIGRAWGLKGLEPEVRKRLSPPAATERGN